MLAWWRVRPEHFDAMLVPPLVLPLGKDASTSESVRSGYWVGTFSFGGGSVTAIDGGTPFLALTHLALTQGQATRGVPHSSSAGKTPAPANFKFEAAALQRCRRHATRYVQRHRTSEFKPVTVVVQIPTAGRVGV